MALKVPSFGRNRIRAIVLPEIPDEVLSLAKEMNVCRGLEHPNWARVIAARGTSRIEELRSAKMVREFIKRHAALSVLSLLALFVGVMPIALSSLQIFQIEPIVVFALNSVAWVFVALMFNSKRKMLIAVEDTVHELNMPLAHGDLQDKLEKFLAETGRYHRAAYAFRAERTVEKAELGTNLRRIVELAYIELGAQAVQLLLFDEASNTSTQSVMVGIPSAAMSQEVGSLSLTNAPREGSLIQTTSNTKIAKQPVIFAGNCYGSLAVEYPAGYEPSRSDMQVLYLLAAQGALMMLDARFTDELLRMRRAGEESIRAKTGFLANLSHEIRGPLGIILNGVELITDGLCGPITESQRETLEMVRNNGSHLIDLVNDVLDYAKVEAGKVTAKPVEIPLHELLDDLATVVRSQALAKKHQLSVEPVDIKLGMLCDKRHARQMLINFLTNAIKYTPEGGKITIAAERLKGNKVKISVTDTGIGIAANQRAKVFSAFERVEDKYALSQTGTGLGMPLTRRLAEVNGGGADFESEVGKGSTFWIAMPAVELEERKAETSEDKEKQEVVVHGNGEEILLVDHDLQARDVLGRYLTHHGFRIIEATTAQEVMKLLRENTIQLAVVENDLPDLAGEELIAVIRSNPRSGAVPIILLSAKAFVFDIERFLKLGVDRCLSKPVDLSELVYTARRLIDETKALAE